jgi:hypothetical protein
MNTVCKPESEPSTLDEAELSTIQGGRFGDFDLSRLRAILKDFLPRIFPRRPAVAPVPIARVV